MSRTHWLAGAFFVALAAGFSPFIFESGISTAQAQNMGVRVVTGRVLDAGDATVTGATVFLKDLKSKNIRSYTSDKEGHFRFTQVSMVEDHELWAELNGKKSAVKTISSWDSRKEMDVDLKLK